MKSRLTIIPGLRGSAHNGCIIVIAVRVRMLMTALPWLPVNIMIVADQCVYHVRTSFLDTRSTTLDLVQVRYKLDISWKGETIGNRREVPNVTWSHCRGNRIMPVPSSAYSYALAIALGSEGELSSVELWFIFHFLTLRLWYFSL